jgi:GT2 family glycosyltransferase
MNDNSKIAAIITTYNGEKWINKCVESLRHSSVSLDIIIIDNGSSDRTKEIIKSYDDIFFLETKTNLGFGKANNLGLEMALSNNADYIFLLNQDAWIENDTIEVLLKVAQSNPSYGVISPLHLNGNYSGLDLNFSKQLAPENCPDFYSDMFVKKFKSLYEIKFVNAAAWFVSRSCIEKVGLFEPMFFLYGEDNNYLQRVTYHHLKIGITPLCSICHDREIRQGNLSEKGMKIWERTFSLIILLNILDSYNKSIMIFLKERLLQITKNIYNRKFFALKYPFAEIIFFLLNIIKLKARRKSYKIAGKSFS